jgi:glycosyltransferase involved in cell wall biosynthesis
MRPVSIVIITHNKGELLANTLQAVLAQIHPGDEVLIVDDGGLDYSVVQQFARHCLSDFRRQCLRYVVLEHQGYRLSLAINIGMQLATHEAIIKIDGDVIPQEGWLECLRRNFTPNTFLAGRIEWQTDTGVRQDARFDYSTQSPKPELFKGNPPSYPQRFWGGNVAGLRQDWEDIGYFNEEFHGQCCEEADAGWRAYYGGKRIQFLFHAAVLHQQHPIIRPHEGNDLLESNKKRYAQGNLFSTWTTLKHCNEWKEISLAPKTASPLSLSLTERGNSSPAL